MQKRTDLNDPIVRLQNSGVSLREIARLLGCNYKTVFKKYIWAGNRAKEFVLKQSLSAETIFFDECESIDHTKLKPLTIAIAVNEKYHILGAKVGTIPAKGKLASISRKKYGYRKDESKIKTAELLSQIKSQLITTPVLIKSDAKPSYKQLVNQTFPDSRYEQFLSRSNKEKRREQKYLSQEKHIHDPLFEINHMCARLRDHIKRLARRSWCTTKKKENLELALYLYITKINNYNFL